MVAAELAATAAAITDSGSGTGRQARVGLVVAAASLLDSIDFRTTSTSAALGMACDAPGCSSTAALPANTCGGMGAADISGWFGSESSLISGWALRVAGMGDAGSFAAKAG